ncbi:MAG: TraR/DksA family transcriptional regulator [Candidatus Rokuibacteriota bacterium]
MRTVRTQLERDLKSAVERLRQLAGDGVPGEPAAAMAVNGHAEEIDKIQAEQLRESSLTTRARLVMRAERLAAALRRLDDGNYGRCVRCGERIQPARLKALPEVETCLECQERLERNAA